MTCEQNQTFRNDRPRVGQKAGSSVSKEQAGEQQKLTVEWKALQRMLGVVGETES